MGKRIAALFVGFFCQSAMAGSFSIETPRIKFTFSEPEVARKLNEDQKLQLWAMSKTRCLARVESVPADSDEYEVGLLMCMDGIGWKRKGSRQK